MFRLFDELRGIRPVGGAFSQDFDPEAWGDRAVDADGQADRYGALLRFVAQLDNPAGMDPSGSARSLDATAAQPRQEVDQTNAAGEPAGPGLTADRIKEVLDQVTGFSNDIYARYTDPKKKTPQVLEAIDGDLQKYDALKRQLNAIALSDQNPDVPVGRPSYSQNALSAALNLYAAASNAGLADPRRIPAAITGGWLREIEKPTREPFKPGVQFKAK